jgi:hypothetical protein
MSLPHMSISRPARSFQSRTLSLSPIVPQITARVLQAPSQQQQRVSVESMHLQIPAACACALILDAASTRGACRAREALRISS